MNDGATGGRQKPLPKSVSNGVKSCLIWFNWRLNSLRAWRTALAFSIENLSVSFLKVCECVCFWLRGYWDDPHIRRHQRRSAFMVLKQHVSLTSPCCSDIWTTAAIRWFGRLINVLIKSTEAFRTWKVSVMWSNKEPQTLMGYVWCQLYFSSLCTR